MNERKRPTWVLNLLLIGIGVVFALAVVGIALALFPTLRPGLTRYTVEMGDIFYHQAPWMRPPENPKDVLAAYWLEWDADGFRVPHRSASNYPVVALGDSFTEAPNAPKPWPDVLAEGLDQPVRNLGFRGFGPRQEMQAFRLYGEPETVETVVIGYFEGNDLSNAFVTRNDDFEPPAIVTDRRMIPTDFSTVTDRDERYPMQIDIDGVTSDIAFLEGYIWVLNGARASFTESRNLALTVESWLEVQAAAPQACVIIAYFPDKSHIYLPYLTAEDRPTLLEKAEETVLGGRRLTQQPVSTTFETLVGNLGNQRDAVAAAAAEAGFPFVDVTPVLEAAASRGELTYYTYDTHWNQRGHDLAGQAIAAYVRHDPCAE